MQRITRDSLDWEMKLVWDAIVNDTMKKVTKSLKEQGISMEVIMISTGLTESEIEAL